MAAAREGCGEIVGMIVMHPNFDCTTVAEGAPYVALKRYAWAGGLDKVEDVRWALFVVEATRSSRDKQHLLRANPQLAFEKGYWFLPRFGEWVPPGALEDMGIDEVSSEPPFPEDALERFVHSPMYVDLLKNAAGVEALFQGLRHQPEVLRRLWYLLVKRVQTSKEDTAQLRRIDHQVRSAGWGVFFRGSTDAMFVHFSIFKICVLYRQRGADEGDDQDVLVMDSYKGMPIVLQALWDHIGTWIVE